MGKVGWRRDPKRALERGRARSSVPPSCGSLQGEGIKGRRRICLEVATDADGKTYQDLLIVARRMEAV